MKTRIVTCLAAISLLAASGITGRTAAQAAHYPYILVDLGTFGGPQSYLDVPATPITPQGFVLGTADTTISDTDYPNFNPYMVGFPDPDISHAFAWHRGILTDLGALPGNNSSAIFELNARGFGAGMSENGTIDPVTGWPADNAVLWQDGHIINLGTLPGGYESQANFINDRGQVAGFASNGILDPYSMGFWGTQARVFLWQDGVMHDLGTLGGPDSFGGLLNERGQVTGQSYINNTPNSATGIPTMDPFLWQDGHMQDLGTLGGTVGLANWINNRGEVVGQSDLAGDQTVHPFLWDGRALRDLGTLGGDYGGAVWINEAGAVTGWATTTGNRAAHAFLWRNGVMTDLGAAPGDTCSFPESSNDRDQVVGHSGLCGTPESAYRGTLWEHGATYRLDTLVAPSAISVLNGLYIDDRGEIVGYGVLPNGDQHVILLVPAPLAALEGLNSNAPAPGTVAPAVPPHASAVPCTNMLPWKAPSATWHARMAHRSLLPCLGG
jgi:probable HAF family extracellular repeat protein